MFIILPVGISGSLTGSSSVPEELIKQVDYAISINPNTSSKLGLAETSDGLFNAFKSRLGRLKAYSEKMEVA